ncbi:transmembrane protein 223 [Prorops nasuta]|uniref:transmembrane protein 223 n=1 Tax=Prorops nasuta TaxID=863751 RepID=UPI0034CEEE11
MLTITCTKCIRNNLLQKIYKYSRSSSSSRYFYGLASANNSLVKLRENNLIGIKKRCCSQNNPSTDNLVDLQDKIKSLRNNVVLYKYDRSRIYRYASYYAIAQCFIWLYAAHVTFKAMLNNSTFKEWFNKFNADIKEGLKTNSFDLALLLLNLLMGPSIYIILYLVRSRSVKLIILNKGGKSLTIVTEHFINSKRTVTVPLTQISTSVSRVNIKSQLPIKVKGYSLFFIVDKNGTFVNPQLFDITINAKPVDFAM